MASTKRSSRSKKKQTRGKGRKKSGATSALRERVDAILERFGPWLAPTAWSTTLAAVVLAWIVGVPRLERAVGDAAWAPQITVEFSELPSWVNHDLLAMLEETAASALGGDPFARGDLAAARHALLSTGWFDHIDQVMRTASDHVVVHGTFARPAAVVRDGEGDHLIDAEARLLPMTFPADGSQHLLAIVGARFDRPQRPGVRWEGADVGAGLRILALFDGRPWREQVAAIDVARFLAEETVIIHTTIGARIVWGSAPGEERPLEVRAADKMAYLDEAYRAFGRIDTNRRSELHFYEQGYFAK